MNQLPSLCRPCRLRLASWPCINSTTSRVSCARFHSRPYRVSSAFSPSSRAAKPQIQQHSRPISTDEQASPQDDPPDPDSLESILADASLSPEERHSLVRSRVGPELIARHARRRFGDRLPEGALSDDEYKVYQRLFGTPLTWTPEHEEGYGEEEEGVLLQENDAGELQEVQRREVEDDEEYEVEVDEDDPNLEAVDPSLRDDIKAALRAQTGVESESRDAEPYKVMPMGDVVDHGATTYGMRTHPYTLASRGGTDPLTLALPREFMVKPTAELLSKIPNRHLKDTSERLFGGPGLPYATGTPRISRTMEQKPIPLTAYQSKMTPIEADVFAATLMPGMYASVMNAIVESRRALGSEWLQGLLMKEGGPSILDAGAGGAGVLAWREVLKAEWARMHEHSGSRVDVPPAPLGKATVLTSSSSLRYRASSMLENTSFLPRLPDYVHVEPRAPGEPGTPHGRKQFDIIVAPHSLWPIRETWQRKQHVQNLWAMLNENGGVLVLLEKGVPRGFEVLAGARQYLLDSLFLNGETPATEPSGQATEDDGGEADGETGWQPKHARGPHRHATPGSIIAPCTTHAKCPMYRSDGVSRQRKDYCRFSQRFYRPSYQQTILGAKSRNHEDAEFSYVSVIRGKKPEELGRVSLPEAGGAERERLQGKVANDRAFAGYEVGDPDLMLAGGQELEAAVSATISNRFDENGKTVSREADANVLTTPLPPTPAPHPLTLPRLILPPLKRPRHVLMDVCTPAGTLERWSITKPFNRQAYRDARKSTWGDLWALGAKSRDGRRVRVGKGHLVDGREPQDVEEAEAAQLEASVGPDAVSRANEASKPRRKLHGREKARTRKREEKAAMKNPPKPRRRAKREEDEDDEDDEDD